MPLRQQVFAISISLALMLLIINLVRTRRLKEEYSILWLLTGASIFILSIWYDLLKLITRFMGIITPASTLFFLGLVFMMIIALHFSVKISCLSEDLKRLTQEFVLFRDKIEHRSA